MATSVRQSLFFFLVPGGVLATAAVLLALRLPLPPPVQAFLPFYPPLVVAAGLFFGWRFHRSRLVLALLVMVVAERTLSLWPDDFVLAAAINVLLPLNLALIAAYGERGLVTLHGLLRLALIALQIGTVALFHSIHPERVGAILTRPLLVWAPFEPFPQHFFRPAPVALTAAGLLMLVVFLRRPGPLEGSFPWALAMAAGPLLAGSGQFVTILGFATAGLILLAAVIETSYRLAYRDELTGLPSRRALNDSLLRVGRRYTLAMIDVDHFKKVNDRHGHDIGDQVLKMVAGRLGRVSGGGMAFRYGGEEFTLLFPGQALDEALPHLERLRTMIEDAAFTLRGHSRPDRKPAGPPTRKIGHRRLSVTVSMGVAERQAEAARPAEVIKVADRALYRAKQGGRNRICCGRQKEGKRSRKGA